MKRKIGLVGFCLLMISTMAPVNPGPDKPATELTLSGIKTGTDRIPSSPAVDHTTAGSPASFRLSNGTSFITPTTPTDTQPVSIGSIAINGSVPVTGTFWQATQPISLASISINGNPILGTGTNSIGTVTVANSSLAVTGTFWQATQPVSLGSIVLNTGTNSIGTITNGGGTVTANASSNNIGSVTVANASIPVTGTFWQSTQPVSIASISINGAIPAGGNNIGSVTVANASLAVTGTFWQSTQPISLAAGATAIAKAEDGASADADVGVPSMAIQKATPADTAGTDGDYSMLQMSAGRLWTPSKIDTALPAGTNNIGSFTLANASVAVTGTFWQATQPVSIASISINGAIPAGANNIGLVTLAASTASIGTILNGGGTVTVNASSNNIGSVTLAASTAAIGTVTNGGGTVQLAAGSNNIGSITLGGLLDTTTGDTGTKSSTFAGATQTNSTGAAGAIITVKLGTVSGTSPTLSCQLQFSYDGGTNWLNIGIAIPNLTATNNVGVYFIGPNNWSTAGSSPATLTNGGTQTAALNMRLPKMWRINYTIGGTTPSFAITNVYVNYVN